MTPDKLRYLRFSLVAIFTILLVSIFSYSYLYITDDAGQIQDLRVTNISANSAIISWSTKSPAKAKVLVSENGGNWSPILENYLNDVFYDNRNVDLNSDGEYEKIKNDQDKRKIHYVTVRNLSPETKYEFRVMGKYRSQSFDKISEFVTTDVEDRIDVPNPGYGKIIDESGNGISEALLVMSLYNSGFDRVIDSSTEIVTYTNDSGGWSIDFNSFKNDDGDNYKYNEGTKLSLKVITEEGSSEANLDINNSKPFDSVVHIVENPNATKFLPGNQNLFEEIFDRVVASPGTPYQTESECIIAGASGSNCCRGLLRSDAASVGAQETGPLSEAQLRWYLPSSNGCGVGNENSYTCNNSGEWEFVSSSSCAYTNYSAVGSCEGLFRRDDPNSDYKYDLGESRIYNSTLSFDTSGCINPGSNPSVGCAADTETCWACTSGGWQLLGGNNICEIPSTSTTDVCWGKITQVSNNFASENWLSDRFRYYPVNAQGCGVDNNYYICEDTGHFRKWDESTDGVYPIQCSDGNASTIDSEVEQEAGNEVDPITDNFQDPSPTTPPSQPYSFTLEWGVEQSIVGEMRVEYQFLDSSLGVMDRGGHTFDQGSQGSHTITDVPNGWTGNLKIGWLFTENSTPDGVSCGDTDTEQSILSNVIQGDRLNLDNPVINVAQNNVINLSDMGDDPLSFKCIVNVANDVPEVQTIDISNGALIEYDFVDPPRNIYLSNLGFYMYRAGNAGGPPSKATVSFSSRESNPPQGENSIEVDWGVYNPTFAFRPDFALSVEGSDTSYTGFGDEFDDVTYELSYKCYIPSDLVSADQDCDNRRLQTVTRDIIPNYSGPDSVLLGIRFVEMAPLIIPSEGFGYYIQDIKLYKGDQMFGVINIDRSYELDVTDQAGYQTYTLVVREGRGDYSFNNNSDFQLSELKNDILVNTKAQNSTQGISEMGSYTIDFGNGYSRDLRIIDDNLNINVFDDLNRDGIRQENEPFIEDYEDFQIQISKTTKITNYNLNPGWNSLGLDTVSEELSDLGSLLTYLENQGSNISQVAIYNGGWISYGRRENKSGEIEEYGNPDENIIPGQGIFVYSSTYNRVRIEGSEFLETIPIFLNVGWNFVSIPNPNQSYTAYSFLDACSDENFLCESIAKYENGLYGIVVLDEGVLFGNDYNLNNKSGYFLKVNSDQKERFLP